jgi:hypothetical protein
MVPHSFGLLFANVTSIVENKAGGLRRSALEFVKVYMAVGEAESGIALFCRLFWGGQNRSQQAEIKRR